MRNETYSTKATMLSPKDGFAERVIARLGERERLRARRRALVGAGLLVVAGAVVVSALAIWTAAWISPLLADPSQVISWLSVFIPLVGGFSEAIGVTARVALESVNNPLVLAYALATLGLTLLWARFAAGTSQHPLTQSSWEVKK
jgi:Na+-driven multidrug efflux pump